MEIFLGVLLVQVVVALLLWLLKPEKKSVCLDPPTFYGSINPSIRIKANSTNRNSASHSSYSSSGDSDFYGFYDAGSHYDSGCFGGGDSGGGGDCGGED